MNVLDQCEGLERSRLLVLVVSYLILVKCTKSFLNLLILDEDEIFLKA